MNRAGKNPSTIKIAPDKNYLGGLVIIDLGTGFI